MRSGASQWPSLLRTTPRELQPRQERDFLRRRPAPQYYLQVVEQLFKENRLAGGSFEILGRTIDLAGMRCPLFLLAARDDDVVASEQIFATAHLVDPQHCAIERATAPCGHLGLFMGRKILVEVWPEIARWLLH